VTGGLLPPGRRVADHAARTEAARLARLLGNEEMARVQLARADEPCHRFEIGSLFAHGRYGTMLIFSFEST
jgi:hypothetical protein